MSLHSGLSLLFLLFVGTSSEMMSVPKEVMSFLVGCEGRSGGPTVPIARTEIDSESGTMTQEVSMMDMKQLRASLKETVDNDQMVGQILTEVEESLAAQASEKQARDGCTNIKIDVPPQEVKGLSEQLQAVVQQNNYQLLEQINHLFSFKLNSFYKEIEALLNTTAKEIISNQVKCPDIVMPAPQPVPVIPVESHKSASHRPIMVETPQKRTAEEENLDSETRSLYEPKSEPEPEPHSEPEPEPQPESEPEPPTSHKSDQDAELPKGRPARFNRRNPRPAPASRTPNKRRVDEDLSPSAADAEDSENEEKEEVSPGLSQRRNNLMNFRKRMQSRLAQRNLARREG